MTKPKVVQNKNKDGEKAAGMKWANANLLNLATPQQSHLAESARRTHNPTPFVDLHTRVFARLAIFAIWPFHFAHVGI